MGKPRPPNGVLVCGSLTALAALMTMLHGLQWANGVTTNPMILGLAWLLTFSNIIAFGTISYWPGIPWIGPEVRIDQLRRPFRWILLVVTLQAALVVMRFRGEERHGGLMLSSMCLATSCWMLIHCIAGIPRIIWVPRWILESGENHTNRYREIFRYLRSTLSGGGPSSDPPRPPATTRKGRIPRRVRKRVRRWALRGRTGIEEQSPRAGGEL